MTIICRKCQVKMRNEARVPAQSMTDTGSHQVFMADLWGCSVCGTTVAVVGTTEVPVATHIQLDYASVLKRLAPTYRYWENFEEKAKYRDAIRNDKNSVVVDLVETGRGDGFFRVSTARFPLVGIVGKESHFSWHWRMCRKISDKGLYSWQLRVCDQVFRSFGIHPGPGSAELYARLADEVIKEMSLGKSYEVCHESKTFKVVELNIEEHA